ncbi:MAG: PAS domain-containing protein [Kiloniellaceae bacterium]
MVMSQLNVDRVTEAALRCLSGDTEAAAVAEALNFEVTGLSFRRDPDETSLPLAEHRTVLRYWLDLPRVDGVANILKIDPHALRSVLGYLMLIDIGEDPNDFHYALYGSKIAAVSGFDMTGKTVWDVATTSAVQTYLAACYRAALQLRCPVFCVHKAPPSITTSHWHRLILPLGENGEIRRFLVCNTPIQDGKLV